jgi:glycosyltransferase involved in cell wall biosynthesis
MEGYVRETIESALAQTYRNTRVIITNDGSTDNSRRIIREVIDDYLREDNLKREPCMKEIEETGIFYEQERKKLWNSIMPDPGLSMTDDGSTYTKEQGYRRAIFLSEVTRLGFNDSDKWKIRDKYYPDGEKAAPIVIDQENRGLSEARNAAIRAGEGEFFLPLDADDYIDPTYVEKTIVKMQDPEVGVVSTDMQYFGLLKNRIPPRGLTLEREMQGNELPVCSLIRRAAYDQIGRGYETLFIEAGGSTRVLGFEDWELFISILKRGWKVAIVNEPLFHYRVRPNSMVAQASEKRAGLTRLIHLLHPDLWPQG